MGQPGGSKLCVLLQSLKGTLKTHPKQNIFPNPHSLFVLFCLSVCLYMCLYMCLQIRSHGGMSWTFSSSFALLPIVRQSLIEPGPHYFASLASHWVLRIHLGPRPPVLGLQAHCIWLSCKYWRFEPSGLCVHVSNTLASELPL